MPDVFVDEPAEKPIPKASTGTPQPQPLPDSPADAVKQEKPRRVGWFTSYCPKPEGVTFENQEDNETILLLLRRHFVTNVPWIILALFFVIVPLFLIPFFNAGTIPFPFSLPDNYVLVLTLLYYLVILGYVLAQFATWFYQIGVITDLRVIDVDFTTLLSRDIAFADIIDIVDVEVVQQGLLQSFFNYGLVQMQTEGVKSNIEFTNIPRPNEVADILSDLMREKKQRATSMYHG